MAENSSDDGVKVTTPQTLSEQQSDNFVEQGLVPAATIGNVAAAARQFAEIKGMIELARHFRRNENDAFVKMRRTCQRQDFADNAFWAYRRGDKIISGPSIRLAEELVRAYRNIDYGFRIMENRDDRSLVEAFAWDVEQNTKVRREFWVLHIRETKAGNFPLTSPRDIYEICANMAQRRVRACIEEILPVDLLEEAKLICRKTMAGGSTTPLKDRVRKMVMMFDDLGVSQAMLEDYLQHPLSAIIVEEMPRLIAIHNSIRDKISSREEFFNLNVVSTDSVGGNIIDIPPKGETKIPPKKSDDTPKGTSDEASPKDKGDNKEPDEETKKKNSNEPTPEEIAEIERREREESEAFEREKEEALAGDKVPAPKQTTLTPPAQTARKSRRRTARR